MSSDQRWQVDHIPDLSGKIALVTGANSGLGYQTTRYLSRQGAHVIMACRDASKAEDAVQSLKAENPAASLEVILLDLASLSAVRQCAADVSACHARVDMLVNNAGIMAVPSRHLTVDGFELQFGVNHLGHFALTGLLLPLLLASDQSRVVTLSSSAHIFGKIDFSNLNGERRYHPWLAYGQSKLANVLFAYALQRRFDAAGLGCLSSAVDPGYAATHLQTSGPGLDGETFMVRLIEMGNRILGQDPARNALATLFAAAAPALSGGEFIGLSGVLGMRGSPVVRKSSRSSYDRQMADQLWQISEKMTSVTYNMGIY